METRLKKITPDLMVVDVAVTVNFYTEKLGFKLEMLVPESGKRVETKLVNGREYVYAMVSRDEVFMMFMRKDVYVEDVPVLKGASIGASATFYCEVSSLSDLYDSFQRKGVEIVKDVSVTWYGMKEFYIRDCNGYILGFAEQTQ
jgi:uncharacterized glyoxalase superfamily protein PhnB